MARKDFIITGLDIGTSFVRAAIAKCNQDDGIEIIGAAVKSSQGVKKSVIVNKNEVTELVRAAVESAENDAGVEVDDLHVGITGGHVNCCTTASVVNNLDADDTIKDKHIDKLIENARANSEEKGREAVHEITQEFRIDGHTVEGNPVGSAAKRVEARVHIITADRTIMENHGRVINDAGFIIAGMCWNVIASGLAVLSDQEKKDGVLLIDIGGGSAGYAVYFNNTIYYANVFAVGGDHITNDLMIGLNINFDEAEDIKKTYGLKSGEDYNSEPSIIKIGTPIRSKKHLSKTDINMIIESRMEELIRFIKNDVNEKGLFSLIGHGIVFVGGSSYLYHLKEKAKNYFGKPVRMAIPILNTPDMSADNLNVFSDRHEFLKDPSCATILGLLKSGYKLKLTELNKSKGFFNKFLRH
ncbi:MAG: cell division protein FtsA [Chlamydiae bacterium]|nr:MAG: cell division protein FtsA [Chlamydiota bacterium]